jgi:hypothetical protein
LHILQISVLLCGVSVMHGAAHPDSFMYTNSLIHPVFVEKVPSGEIVLSETYTYTSNESVVQSSQAAAL